MKTRLRGAGRWLAAGCAVMVAGGLTGAGQAPPQFGVQTDREVIAAMTAEEKVGLVVGTGMRMPGLPPEMQGPAVGATQSGVPGAAGIDARHPAARDSRDGRRRRTGGACASPPCATAARRARTTATAFPIATLLASTWDVGVLERVGQAMGNEVRRSTASTSSSGPPSNTHRNPLGGPELRVLLRGSPRVGPDGRRRGEGRAVAGRGHVGQTLRRQRPRVEPQHDRRPGSRSARCARST